MTNSFISQNITSAFVGKILAEYLTTSSDSLAVAFRARYGELHPSSVLVPEGNYQALLHYMQSRDSLDNYLARVQGKKSKLAKLLTREVGWPVKANTLVKTLERVKKESF